MPRMFAGFVPPMLAVLALLLPSQAVAGPPERASGKMVFIDRVTEELRRFRQEDSLEKLEQLFESLAPTRDPRVGLEFGRIIALCEVAGTNATRFQLLGLFNRYYSNDPPPVGMLRNDELQRAARTWKARKAEFHRRAKQLPQ